MWMIRHISTNKWLRSGSIYWSVGSKISDRLLTSRGGRVFKRRSDLSNHINSNLQFYTEFSGDFEVVEFEIREKDADLMAVHVDKSHERQAIRKAEDQQRRLDYERQRLAQMEQEVAEMRARLQ